MRALRRFLVTLAALYIAYGGVMVWLHPQFIYPFSQKPLSDPALERVEVPRDAGAPPLAVFAEAGRADRPVILYFMGNLGAVEVFLPGLALHRSQGRGVVAMSYAGGGGEPGAPSEQGLKADALRAFDAAAARYPGRPIIVHGFSLGTGLALHVGARRDVAGVVLSAPYDRICRLMVRGSGLPACHMPVQRWDSLRDVAQQRAPVLIVHGSADQVIPPEYSRVLAEALEAAGKDMTRTIIDGAGHNNLIRFDSYAPAITGFIRGL